MSKTVVITGATGGIGEAAVWAFAEDDYQIALMYHKNQKKAEALVKSLKDRGVNADCFAADLSSFEETARAAEEIFRKFNSVNVLVNNAGISQIKLFGDITEQDWDTMMDVNVKSVFNCCKQFLPYMISEKSGKIINVSSMWGVQGASCEVHYSASKAAIIGFTKALAQEVGLSCITVNCIAPGVIDTPMNDELSPGEKEDLKSQIPLFKIGTGKNIADSILFLASEKADYITGQVINVNGGMVL